MRRLLRFAGPCVAFAAALAVFSMVAGGDGEAGGAPRAAAVAVEVRPGASTEQTIRATRRALERAPGAAALHASLGDLYYQRGRETADSQLNEDARAAYTEALRLEPGNPAATLGLGTLALAKHDFAGGLRQGRRALALQPRSVAAYPVIVDALVELGRYSEAARTIDRMVKLKPNLASYSRVSYFRELHGDVDGAVQAMRFALSAGAGAGENAAYVQTLLGNLEFSRGRIAAARKAYAGALKRFPGFLGARAGLATVSAARGDLDAAIARYRRVVEASAVHEYHVLLLEAELAAGRTPAARRDIASIRRNQRVERRNGVNTDAELAIFEAEHGAQKRAVALGAAAVADAPSVAAADAYSWALTKAGRGRAALRWARRALRLGSQDPLFLYHAGMAARAAGKPAPARRWLKQALARNPSFSPLHAPRARSALRALQEM